MTLVELHRELHLNGYAIASRHPVKRLADALGYEHLKGRARRVERGVVHDRRAEPRARAAVWRRSRYSPRTTSAINSPAAVGIGRDAHAGGLERVHLRLRGALRSRDDRARVAHLLAGRRGHARDVAHDRLRHLRA